MQVLNFAKEQQYPKYPISMINKYLVMEEGLTCPGPVHFFCA